MAIFFIILFALIILSRVSRLESQCEYKAYRVSLDKSLMEKWAPVLDFGIYDPSGVHTSPPIPERDKPMVAILFEQSECYCMKNKIYKNPFLGEIRRNYKTTTYDFS